jgi:UDP-2-acetamido-2,6-beta-L-arabino-hexul-4-ose reductase
VHCAGVNRTDDENQFIEGNVNLTQVLCDFIAQNSKSIPLIYTSSYQATVENAYGSSKKRAEELILSFSNKNKDGVVKFNF